LARNGQYVEAIEQQKYALDLFVKESTTITASASIQVERAHTMIAMGDAHVRLAISIRGHHQRISPAPDRLQRLQHFFDFFLSLPLVLYLGFYLGYRVWHPRFWSIVGNLDWIVARLFATGANLYAKADPILEKHGAPSERVRADEQLANLFLAMGDAEQACFLFSRLLAEVEAPLGEYRRASVRASLGQALISTAQFEQARRQLEEALPVLVLYEDDALQARGEALLAEALLHIEAPVESIPYFVKALDYYQQQADELMSTEVVERLEQFASDTSLPAEQQDAVANIAKNVVHRRYLVRYRHAATVFFQRATLGLMALIIFLIPASIIRMETGITILPEIAFSASPLLRSDAPDFTPDLGQGVEAIDLTAALDPDLLLWLGVLLFLAYLILSTGFGIAVISGTSLANVQARA
jgi:tetratricopeptide (TPR) repeat protein